MFKHQRLELHMKQSRVTIKIKKLISMVFIGHKDKVVNCMHLSPKIIGDHIIKVQHLGHMGIGIHIQTIFLAYNESMLEKHGACVIHQIWHPLSRMLGRGRCMCLMMATKSGLKQRWDAIKSRLKQRRKATESVSKQRSKSIKSGFLRRCAWLRRAINFT
jgi:hypothetical protein